MRHVAAAAVNQLFADAKVQGISLLGVSGYRSHATQTSLFNSYVSRDGYEKAITYSALPGTSEHETGLRLMLLEEVESVPQKIVLAVHLKHYGLMSMQQNMGLLSDIQKAKKA